MEKATYEQMLSEVESIIEELSLQKLELDQVVGKVERGYAILTELRDKLDKVSLKITQIRENYQENKE